MGLNHFLPGLALSALAIGDTVRAQGVVYREHWGYLHLEHRRAELLESLRSASPEQVRRVGELIGVAAPGQPFGPVGEALAALRGVEADEAFQFRCALSVFVLPEVVDPTSTVEACRRANFSIFLPFQLPMPADPGLTVVVRDAEGAEVFRETLRGPHTIEDLRMARSTVSMPVDDLPDGTYDMEVVTTIAGEAPRAGDCRLGWRVHVLRGYQQRCDRALADAASRRDALDALPRALLDGLALQVSRAYAGDAYEVRSEALLELERLEVALQNLDDEAPILRGIRGPVSTALPAGEHALPCRLRLVGEADREAPLVVFVSGTPAYDATGNRPSEPATSSGRDLDAQLAGFDQDGRYHVAFLCSPGGGRAFHSALEAALDALPSVMPTGGRKVLLVCEREAAAIAALRATKLVSRLAGLVLVGTGAMPPPVVDSLGELPVRVTRLANYPAGAHVDRLLDYVDTVRAAGREPANVALLHDRELPWWFGTALSGEELMGFAALVFGDR